MVLRPRHQAKRYIKWLLGCCVFTLLLGTRLTEYLSDIEKRERDAFQIGRLANYEEIRKENGIILDTYFRRLEQFLEKQNGSMLSYEQSVATNPDLLAGMKKEVAHLQRMEQQELFRLSRGEEIRSGCAQTCCWSERRMRKFYRGEKDRAPTVLDRLSQIDFKLLADVHYGNLRKPNGSRLTTLTSEILPCLQKNTVIFVDTTDLSQFFGDFHGRILVDYILITGDSDLSCPFYYIRRHFHLLEQIFAGKTHIRHWFSMNCHLGGNAKWQRSSVFTCIPQGLSQWFDQRYFLHLASGKDDSIFNRHLKTNEYWILSSFNRKNGLHREEAWDLSCHGRLKSLSKCFYRSHSEDPWKYYLHLARSKFVLSPPGDGLDCYRTWEALYLGAIPIVLNRSINSIFDKLPVLIVNDYEEITEGFLADVYQKMTHDSYDYSRLYKGYWQSLINSYRNSTVTIQIHYSSSSSSKGERIQSME